jgi:hypothetical protein
MNRVCDGISFSRRFAGASEFLQQHRNSNAAKIEKLVYTVPKLLLPSGASFCNFTGLSS